ncbi:polysaccharide deacetylase family protein [Aurantibacter sp.]|uniref:polysaccharide deacetylase family protein n=1 Tax=Aurantibacter sp. TaxID=2807103 RepID=UPI0035C79E92
MKFTPVKTPYLVRWFFSKYTWKKPTAKKILYLTFDDGPTPEITTWVLQQLKNYNAKATFFCIGNNIEKHPELFKTIISEGHNIGNHTQNHIKGWKTSTKKYLEDVNSCELIIKKHNNSEQKNKLFRPPFGQINSKQGKQLIDLGYKIIMWSILTFDWDKNYTNKQCLNFALKARRGDVIVMHDSIKASNNLKYMLPKLLEHYNKKEYLFKTL